MPISEAGYPLAGVAANRANAQLSTGPRTPEGTAAASLNALAHGAYASHSTIRSPPPSPYNIPAPNTPPLNTFPPSVPAATQGTPLPAGDGPGVRGTYREQLAVYIAAYAPATPPESLYVERAATLHARLDLVRAALDS